MAERATAESKADDKPESGGEGSAKKDSGKTKKPKRQAKSEKKGGKNSRKPKQVGEKKPSREESFVHIYPEWCKGCGICVEFCPKDVLSMGDDQKAHVEHPENCIRCFLCARRCPDFAITVADQNGIARREEGDDQ